MFDFGKKIKSKSFTTQELLINIQIDTKRQRETEKKKQKDKREWYNDRERNRKYINHI